ncbi:MAG TPA: transcriptional regulator [Nocardioides bacterium]|nr:transcriptional regulator [Nocardioides sp.]
MQTFLLVYDTGSARAAAQALHVTPPAVSAAVGALEDALGAPLLERVGRTLRPTDAGRTFAGYARTMLGMLGEAAASVREAETGRLRLGVVATVSEYVLPRLLAGFVQRFPQVDLSVSVLPRDELFARAAEHQVDVVVAGRPPAGSPLRTRARRDNQLVVVSAPGVEAATGRWLLTGQGSGTRQAALALVAGLESEPPTLTLGTQGAVLAAARAGLGLALAHEAAVGADLRTGSLVRVPWSGVPLLRPWHLCTAASPTPTTELFLDHATDSERVGEDTFHPRVPLQG